MLAVLRRIEGMLKPPPDPAELEQRLIEVAGMVVQQQQRSDDLAERVAALEDGRDLAEVIAEALRRQGRDPREKVERNDAIKAAVKAGATQREVAEQHGIAKSRVSAIVRNPSNEKAERNAEIFEAAEAGVEYKEIAEQHGIGRSRVSSIVVAERAKRERG